MPAVLPLRCLPLERKSAAVLHLKSLSLVSRAASLPPLLRRASSYGILLFPYLAVENFFRCILVSLSLHRERFLDFIAQGPCILAVENFFRRILVSLSSHRERFLDFVVQGACMLVLCSSFCLRGFLFLFFNPPLSLCGIFSCLCDLLP